MVSNEFRLTYCRFCIHKVTNPKYGAVCDLNPIPKIQNEECPKFSQDAEYVAHLDNLKKESEEYEKEEFTVNYWQVLKIAVPIIVGIITYFQTRNLNTDYRWTVGTTYSIDSKFSLSFPFIGTKYLRYKYSVNGVNYDGKTKVDGDVSDAKADHFHYFVKFQTNNPKNSEILDFKMIPFYISPTDFPADGVAKDSLKIFMNIKKKNYYNRVNKPQEQSKGWGLFDN